MITTGGEDSKERRESVATAGKRLMKTDWKGRLRRMDGEDG